MGTSDLGIQAAANLTSVVLNSGSNTNSTNENLTVYTNQDSNASVKLIYDWKNNSASIAVLNMPFEFDGNQNATDYSGYGNNGSLNGATWNSSGGHDDFGAYQFDGVNDYIQIAGGPEFTLKDFSLAARFRSIGGTAENQNIVNNFDSDGEWFSIHIFSDGDSVFPMIMVLILYDRLLLLE